MAFNTCSASRGVKHTRVLFLSTLSLALFHVPEVSPSYAAFTSWQSQGNAKLLRHHRSNAQDRSLSPCAMRAESFDPFGWKGALKDTFAGLQDALNEEDETPSEGEEKMMKDIFEKFDKDKDGILNLDEFNALQIASEGPDCVYNRDQLVDLLLAVNGELETPEKGMPFAEYRRLYVSPRLRRSYNTDVYRDYKKIFPEGGATTPKIELGAKVLIDGLKSAEDLNGQEGLIVQPVEAELDMVQKEGRFIVQMDDGERIALRAANLKPKA